MFPPLYGPAPDVPPLGELLPIPHTFHPTLTFSGALIAMASWVSRIILGNILFAFWGAGSLMVWSRIHSYFWRALAVPPLILLFLVSFAALMIAITMVMRWIFPQRP
jgi:hypothetical protein